MTAADDAPRAKRPVPPLTARAERPRVVRLRKSVVALAVMGAAGLLAGALAWAFILEPPHRARAHTGRAGAVGGEPRGAVRPSERVTRQPGSYAQLPQLQPLPEPRALAAGPPAAKTQPVHRTPEPADVRGPSSSGDPTAEAGRSGLFFQSAPPAGAEPPAAGGPATLPAGEYAGAYNPHALLAPLSPFEVKAGTVITAALLTGVDTARAGPVVAAVSANIFDTVTGTTLLVPQGSRLIGRQEGESRHGERRAYLTWERLILPNGKSLLLAKEPGVDAQGAAGVEGRVDRRILPLAVATLFAGAITTIGQAARDHHDHSGGLLGDAGDAAAVTAAQTGGRLIDRELEVHPSIRVAPGSQVRVLITRDLVLEPYRP